MSAGTLILFDHAAGSCQSSLMSSCINICHAGLAALLGPTAAAAARDRLQLHARSIAISRCGRSTGETAFDSSSSSGQDATRNGTRNNVRVVAPVPPHMAAVLGALGWRQAEAE